jgi:TRAP-type transport system small permease protein
MTRYMDMLETMIRWTVVFLLFVMVAAIGSQVFARYLFHQSLYWTEELGRHVMVWMIFLASVLCVRRGFHLSITLLKERLKPDKQALMQLIGAIVLAYFFYMMIVHGWTLTQKTMVQRSSAIHYPMGYVYAALPVSGLLMFIVNLEVMINAGLEFFGKRKGEAIAQPVGTGGEST